MQTSYEQLEESIGWKSVLDESITARPLQRHDHLRMLLM
jgi:hypothetical protein